MNFKNLFLEEIQKHIDFMETANAWRSEGCFYIDKEDVADYFTDEVDYLEGYALWAVQAVPFVGGRHGRYFDSEGKRLEFEDGKKLLKVEYEVYR